VAKGSKNNDTPTTPTEYPQVTPRDLYPTSDIRFVMVEIGKLTANVDRLIEDVKSHGGKLDDIKHNVSFVRGAVWASAGLIAALIAVVSFFLSSKWDAMAAALAALQKHP
jgi:hypothetical protein